MNLDEHFQTPANLLSTSFRKTFFWLHLAAGVVAGVAIAVMCFTGAMLAFEKQLVAWAERDARLIAPPVAGVARLPIAELTRRLRAAQPDTRPDGITVSADPSDAVTFSAGRDTTFYVNPYTGEVRQPSSTSMRDFMHTMEQWHRWLACGGDNRSIGKAVNDAANLAFFFLAISGLYLWCPRPWSWRGVRTVAFLNWRFTGKARDFNWHNCIGIWFAAVLVVLTLTAVPMSYRWGNALVYRLVGETPPARAGRPDSGLPAIELPKPPDGARPLDSDVFLAAARKACPEWEQITLRTGGPGPGPRAKDQRKSNDAPAAVGRGKPDGERSSAGVQPITCTVKEPGAWPRTAMATLTLNPFTGEVLRHEKFGDQSPGRQLRIWSRFLHTGEALGFGGQLIAGLASLGGCLLTYTGFALTWRRFFGSKPGTV